MNRQTENHKKREAPSVKGNPAVRPNSPVQRDEAYRAPSGAKNESREYELPDYS